jgi:hypothetical protein
MTHGLKYTPINVRVFNVSSKLYFYFLMFLNKQTYLYIYLSI